MQIQYTSLLKMAAADTVAGGAEQDMDQDENEEQTQSQGQGAKTKRKITHPCVYCNKSAASGSIQCTICGLWCQNNCSGMSKEVLKNL